MTHLAYSFGLPGGPGPICARVRPGRPDPIGALFRRGLKAGSGKCHWVGLWAFDLAILLCVRPGSHDLYDSSGRGGARRVPPKAAPWTISWFPIRTRSKIAKTSAQSPAQGPLPDPWAPDENVRHWGRAPRPEKCAGGPGPRGRPKHYVGWIVTKQLVTPIRCFSNYPSRAPLTLNMSPGHASKS